MSFGGLISETFQITSFYYISLIGYFVVPKSVPKSIKDTKRYSDSLNDKPCLDRIFLLINVYLKNFRTKVWNSENSLYFNALCICLYMPLCYMPLINSFSLTGSDVSLQLSVASSQLLKSKAYVAFKDSSFSLQQSVGLFL